jgi:hypothetical protein
MKKHRALFIALIVLGAIFLYISFDKRPEAKLADGSSVQGLTYSKNESDTMTILYRIIGLKDGQSIDYAGCYIENGITNYRLVYSSAKNIDQSELLEKINKVNSKGQIRISDAQYSLSELKHVNDILVQNTDSLSKKGYVGSGVSEKDNRVSVIVKNVNDDIKNEIGKLVDVSTINFTQGEVMFTTNN